MSMSSSPQAHKSGLPRAKRLKIDNACQSCRSRKVKCDGVRPACGNCEKRASLRGNCTYNNAKVTSDPPVSPELPDGHEVGGVMGMFDGQVKAAIDARLGLPSTSTGKPAFLPMADAPLFGLLYRHQPPDNSVSSVDNVLPPRKHADYLMDLYWRYIQPLEPFLEQEQFTRSYQALFAGTSLDEDERIFLSCLNTVFALSTQLQEGLQLEKREEASNTYFHRAWTLLRPDAIIWELGSLELVQCLLLMSRYLQCTNNPHQTWMAVGSAVRIAQSLGLHIPDASSSGRPSHEGRRRRQLWQCCVFMDRLISWALGRTSMISLTSSPSTAAFDYAIVNDSNGQPLVSSAFYFTRMLEVYEIANHIILSQTPPENNFGDKLGLPRLYQNEDPFGTLVQLDACLDKWEKSLPQPLRLGTSQGNPDDASNRQGVLLHLRFLHTRIILYRPMLARYCTSPHQVTTISSLEIGLGGRLIQDCAALCIDCAQKMISLIHNPDKWDGPIGIIPWWHRVLYLRVAGTILIAAMLRADLFTPMVSQSWSITMSALHAHKHLSPFVQQCVTTFQTLSSKISEIHHPLGGDQFPPPEGGVSSTYFQDVFQDMGFDPGNFLFGREDVSWLNNFESTQ